MWIFIHLKATILKTLLFVIVLLCATITQAQNRQKAKELVAKMTTEEKIRLVTGTGMSLPGTPPTNLEAGKRYVDKVPGAAGSSYDIPKVNVPSIILADGPAGLRILPTRKEDAKTFYATAFPVATLLASTWDTVLVKKVGTAMGNEIKEYGVDVFLGPALNIHRNPLGGRNFEYYSEDPLVSGNMAAAMVNGIEANGVGTSIKHFAANNQETNRMLVNTILSERALREIYLKGFEITVKKSQPWTIMSSYNKINGTYTSEAYELLTTILRKEWGYKGLVMTDWFARLSAVAQMNAGNDLLMPGTPEQIKELTEGISNGSLPMEVLNENAERMVNLILQSPTYNKYKYSNTPNLKANAIVARTAAAEGIVLLQNKHNTLPLHKSIKKIAPFGNTSFDIISGGTGSGDVNEAYTISLVEGIQNAGFKVDEDLKNSYEQFIKEEKLKRPKKKFFFELEAPLPEKLFTENEFAKKADDADIAFITIGRNAGEFQDRKIENDFNLSEAEKQLIKSVSTAFHAKNKKLVIILNIGGVIETASWKDDADAIVLVWQGGQEAGNAIADVLSGKINPSGKLATTFPKSYDDVSSAKTFPGKNIGSEEVKGMFGMSIGYDSEVTYDEGIYVGYRYYNTFNVKTAYEFGYGLSYTNFKYSAIKLNNNKFTNKIIATITITNTGKIAGKEVVQLYLKAPTSTMDKPLQELKGFAKTNLLQPGKSETITFELNTRDLASFNTVKTAWIADAGNYKINIGSSSLNIKQTVDFTVAKEIIVEKCNKVLQPKVEITELKKL
jgi:beta-glucosidase